jgi:hypothetical protein
MRALTVLALSALSCTAADPAPIAADRPILEWSGTTAVDANQAQFPKGFAGPDDHACAIDPSRQYIGEIFDHGIDDIEVLYHWAPIVAGPESDLPTVRQPEISLAGDILGVSDSDDDVLADHPFGTDVNADVKLDPPFAGLGFEPGLPSDAPIHPEVELGVVPRTALGYTPQKGDRTLLRGAWVLDCGHPPYGAEMHPPTFLAYARPSDPRTTLSAALVVPYRSSLLFHPDPTLADLFGDTPRLRDIDTRTFSKALVQTILHAVEYKADRLEAHALMVENRFDKLTWHVCAPLPRPPGARLDASWRFTARTGVTLDAAADDAAGCVRIVATMDSTYTPMPLPHADTDWSWDQLSKSASGQVGMSIDVRQEILDILAQKGVDGSTIPALGIDHPPRIDAYAALHTRPNADQDSPIAIDARADDQPFPLYGRVRAAWK